MKATIAILLIVGLFTSCVKDADIKFDTPNVIVVNSFFNPDSIFKVNVSESVSSYADGEASIFEGSYEERGFLETTALYESKHFRMIEDATVVLYEDGKNIGEMTSVDGGYYIIDYKPKEKKEYKIEVSSPKGYFSESKNIIPEKAKIIAIDTLSNSTSSHLLNCKITFEDKRNTQDFYFLEIRTVAGKYNIDYFEDDIYNRTDSFYYEQSIPFDYTDEIIEQKVGSNNESSEPVFYGVVFSDELINGKQKEITITINKYDIADIEDNVVRFYLKTISKDYYIYAKSYGRLLNQEQDFLAEPVNVYSNITNGFGVFGGYSQSVDSIIFNRDFTSP